MRRAISSMLAPVFLLVGCAAAQGALLAWYQLDEIPPPDPTTAEDSAGTTDGTYETFTTTDWGQAGAPNASGGSSVLFRADSGQRIDLGASGGALGGLTTATAAVWVNFSTTSGDHTILSIDNFGDGSDSVIFWRDDSVGGAPPGSGSNDTLAVLIGSPLGTSRTAGAQQALNDTGVWHHVAFTYEANTTNGLKLYIDGERSGPAVNTRNAGIPTADILAAGNVSDSISNDKDYVGLLDDIAIWDEVLTLQQIRGLYEGGSPDRLIPEPATLLVWSLLAGLGVGLGWRRRR